MVSEVFCNKRQKAGTDIISFSLKAMVYMCTVANKTFFCFSSNQVDKKNKGYSTSSMQYVIFNNS